MLKRRIGLLVVMFLVSVSIFAIASCGAPEIEGLSFAGATETYDGTEKTIEVSGLPEGATVTYAPQNTFKDAGEHVVTATVKQDGFADTTLTATLTILPKTVTVTYENLVFKSSGSAPKSVSYTVNGVLEGDTVELEFDFGGCDFSEEGEEGTLTATSKNPNYTLKANSTTKKFTVGPNVHKISYVTGVDGQTIADSEADDNTKIREPRKLINMGYEFLGWFFGEELWDFTNNRVTDDMTLVAKWKANEYTISYQLNGGTNAPTNPDKYSYDKGATILAPQKDGYLFMGWFTDVECKEAAKEFAPFTLTTNVTLYAKWSTEKYSTMITDKTLAGTNNAIIGDMCAVNGDFRYTFVADIDSFGENGAIYIGRGKNTVSGSYVEINSAFVKIHTNGTSNEITSDNRIHGRKISGYISVDVVVSSGKATVTVHTVDGSAVISDLAWVGSNGEIFASCENAELSNASFAWYTNAYDNGVWVVGDASVGLDAGNNWTNIASGYGYGDFLSIGNEALDSAAALEVFKLSLEINTPKFAVWSFIHESGEEYNAALAEFISTCEAKNITPILTTHSPAIEPANTAKNEAVRNSGKRYIDFAAAAENAGVVDQGIYTAYGAQILFARVMIDFAEIICADAPVRTQEAETLAPIVVPEEKEGTPVGALRMDGNAIKDGKYLIFTANIDGALKDGDVITIGHGYKQSTSTWLEIRKDELLCTTYYSWTTPNAKRYNIDFEIKNFLTVIITYDTNEVGKTISLFTDGNYIVKKDVPWLGNVGEMFAMTQGSTTLTNCQLNWVCKDYAKDIWMFGDSYFSLGDIARWPTYMYRDGYQNALVAGHSGMKTKAGYENLEDALKYAEAPEFVVWCMGMNDGDEAGQISSSYKEYTEKMIKLCQEHDIEMVIATIPNCPRINHTYKNADILNHTGIFKDVEYRILDFAHAVGSDVYSDSNVGKQQPNGTLNDTGYEWFPGMLYTDIVHPAVPGARALYLQFIHDFPEIAGGIGSETYEAAIATLNAGQKLEITPPTELGTDKMFTFTADFTGASLSGTIKIGNGSTEDGATWVEITSNTVAVYMMRGGEAILVSQSVANHNLNMRELIAVKIHVVDGTAKIQMYSYGEMGTVGNALFSITASWASVGKPFATCTGQTLTNAEFRWRTW